MYSKHINCHDIMCVVSVLCASHVDRVTDISTSVQGISSVMHVPQSNSTPPPSHPRIARWFGISWDFQRQLY